MNRREWDAVVVGGGPAGLSAALWLARYRRDTLVLDDDRPRNEAAWAVHGFPGLPDPKPEELRRRLHEQAVGAGAVVERRRVAAIEGSREAGFDVGVSDGEAIRARRVVLAYGRTDRLPDIEGIEPLYGTSVFHCPDCDGPSVTGCDVGVLGHDRRAAALALYLLTWVRRVRILTHGLEPELEPDTRRTLDRWNVDLLTAPVVRLEGSEGALERVRFDDGVVRLDGLFFHWGSDPATDLAHHTGCECEPSGDIRVDPRTLETSVAGIYAAGDIVGRPHLVISAAAEGVRAALSLHRSLLPPEFEV